MMYRSCGVGISFQDMPERDQAHQHQFSPPTIQAAVRARVQERTGRCDMPDIIDPVIMAGVPLTSAVKFGEPLARIAVTEVRALCPLNVPENTTEFWCLKWSVKV
jgi:hypothetical protein